MSDDLIIIGEADDRTIQQMRNCLDAAEGARGALLPDNHLGYSQPIGGAVAYPEHLSPSGVGYDIGCGNKAVETNLLWDDIADEVPRLMDEIEAQISFGLGRKNNEPVEHFVLDAIANARFEPQRELHEKACEQLGTVGTGNHYVDLFRERITNRIWVGVHFGSRGFGHNTASGFLAMAQGLPFSIKERRAKGLKVQEGEMMSPPVLFHQGSAEGQAYLEAMRLAGDYAYAGRDIVVAKVLEILGAESVAEVHNHHNFLWREQHDGTDYWVVRKGCTPAAPGQEGFVGATMGEDSVILQGTDQAERALYSTVHGAGRAMSRTAAGGKVKKRWTCNTRDCDWVQGRGEHKPDVCPSCGNAKMTKRMVQVRKGVVDWDDVQAGLAERGIELRGAAADEAPEAYKRLDVVLRAAGDTIAVTTQLEPIGVAMAPGDVKDPYKD